MSVTLTMFLDTLNMVIKVLVSSEADQPQQNELD